ncbi:MAG: COX15/CtaA family protein [Pseudorhodobacter sp.]|nr:COX15/CtaA family protein [Pseudorhodobacter sp.]
MAGKRSIFEEVGSAAAVQPAGGMIAARAPGARGAIRAWLVLIFMMVAAMVLVGGLTRLTDSGLSITEWRPVMGAFPPMNEADWADQFARYQASPQYKLMNAGMALADFKTIFWWEWAHRNLGRLIGLVWAAGFFGFLAARKIPAGWTGRLLGLGALGGLQGAIGWWMVSSGLTGAMISVASYRLAVHLGLAFTILGLCAAYVFLLGRSEIDLMQARRVGERRLLGISTGLMYLLFLQILLGALVAGIDAGRAFPTWPDMNGSFFPADAFYVPDSAGGVRPMWAAFFENPGLVQFIHRMTGYLLFALGVMAWLRGRKSAYQATRGAFNAAMAMLVLQVALGIYTALTAAQLHVALTHQLGAVVLWVLVIRARHMAKFPVQGSIRKGTA